MKKVALLFSGGPDSTAAASLLQRKGLDVHLLTLHESQKTKNDSEVKAASQIAKILDLKHNVIDISFTNSLFSDVKEIAVGLGGGNSPSKKHPSVSKNSCVAPGLQEAPFSLPVMHTFGCIFALTHKCNELIWAVHAEDDVPPGGWIEEYVCSMNKMLQIYGHEPILSTPFMNMSKAELMRKGLKSGAPLDISFSCLDDNNGESCGHCQGCLERDSAFATLHSQVQLTSSL